MGLNSPNRRVVIRGAAAMSLTVGFGRSSHAQTLPDGFKLLARNLTFPEGPVALGDGSLLFVEIPAGRLNRITPDGKLELVTKPGAGPNGMAIGPDGGCYVVLRGNRGGPPNAPVPPGPVVNGSLVRVDLKTKAVKTLYTRIDGRDLGRLDDIVFDEWGDCWISDLSKKMVYWARADGSELRVAARDVSDANGIRLSPDGRTLYVSESWTRALVAFTITERGTLAEKNSIPVQRTLAKVPGDFHFDSCAVEADGSVIVCAVSEGLYRYSPDGQPLDTTAIPGFYPTNLAFGGPDMRTVYCTGYDAKTGPGGTTGQVVSFRWPRPGLRLRYS